MPITSVRPGLLVSSSPAPLTSQNEKAAELAQRILKSSLTRLVITTTVFTAVSFLIFPPLLAKKVSLIFAVILCASHSKEAYKHMVYEASLGIAILSSKSRVFKQEWYHPIREKLLLGAIPLHNHGHLQALKREGVTAVLSLVEDFETQPTLFGIPVTKEQWEQEGMLHCAFPCVDFCAVPEATLRGAVDFIHQHPGKVYVHCKAGVGRSAAVVIAYLIAKEKLTLRQAIDEVRKKRHINPRRSLMILEDFALQCHSPHA